MPVDKKLSELDPLVVTSDDLLYVVDAPGGSTGHSKATWGNLIRRVPDGTVAAPGLALASEESGLYLVSAGVLGIARAGTLGLSISSAAVDVGTKKLSNVVDPTAAQDAATKAYADSAGVTDHGGLTGLSDDDHTQYHTDARALAWLQGLDSIATTADGLGANADETKGYRLRNTTAATVGVPVQASPPVVWEGQGYDTLNLDSDPVEFMAFCVPTSANPVTGEWRLQASVEGGAYSDVMIGKSGGGVQVPDGTEASPGIQFTSDATGIRSGGAANLRLVVAGADRFRVDGDFLQGANTGGVGAGCVVNETASATNPTLCPGSGDVTTGVGTSAAGQISLIGGGTELLAVTGSALTLASGVTLVGPATFDIWSEFSNRARITMTSSIAAATTASITMKANGAANALVVQRDGDIPIEKKLGVGVGPTLDMSGLAQTVINQNDVAGAVPCLELDQDDTDREFIEFDGSSGTGTSTSITTWTTGQTIQGHVQVTINGTKRWIPFYDDPTA